MIVTAANGVKFRWWLIMKDGSRREPGPLVPYKLADIDHAEFERLA